MGERLDPDLLDDDYDVWASDPVFCPAIAPAHWLMVAEVAGPIPGGPMTKKKMTRQEEHDFYADPKNQAPHGPARRRGQLTEMVPVRFPPDTLAVIRQRADDEDRSVSNWIRRAVEHELAVTAGQTNDDKRVRTEDGATTKPVATRTKTDHTARRRTPRSAS